MNRQSFRMEVDSEAFLEGDWSIPPTREEEVDIAQKIESGRQELLSMVLRCPIAVSQIITLRDDLRAGRIA